MASNRFGTIFTITTWGESHGKAIGVVIDGCPANLPLHDDEINDALEKRSPGKNPFTSPRKEKDRAEILSGVFEGKTTGSPISILIPNLDADSSKYEPIKDLLRPGHANFTYLEKYGIFDYRGGGRASARETAARVAAGAVAKKLLKTMQIDTFAYIQQIGEISATISFQENFRNAIDGSPIFCPSKQASEKMMESILATKKEGDSLGGVVEFYIKGCPIGLGDPVYEKLEANLSFAMLSIPATKGFEIGYGFKASSMLGSEHNDTFNEKEKKPFLSTNHAGGILGGITNGEPIIGRVAFKPTSSIQKSLQTVTTKGEKTCFVLPEGSRHDPCVAIRAVPVVEAMASLCLVDAILLNRCSRL